MRRVFLLFLIVVLVALCVPSEVQARESLVTAVAERFGGRLVRMWGFHGPTQSWKLYDPKDLGSSNLYVLKRGQGYWIKVTEDMILYWDRYSYNLRKGWNMLGWQGEGSYVGCSGMSYKSGDDSKVEMSVENKRWYGQTFTCPSSCQVIAVRVKLARLGDIGNVVLRFAEFEGGRPSSVLSSVVFEGSEVTTTLSGGWCEIPVYVSLKIGSVYTIFLVPLSGEGTLIWRCDSTHPGYGCGNLVASSTGGRVWVESDDRDFMFEIVKKYYWE